MSAENACNEIEFYLDTYCICQISDKIDCKANCKIFSILQSFTIDVNYSRHTLYDWPRQDVNFRQFLFSSLFSVVFLEISSNFLLKTAGSVYIDKVFACFKSRYFFYEICQHIFFKNCSLSRFKT